MVLGVSLVPGCHLFAFDPAADVAPESVVYECTRPVFSDRLGAILTLDRKTDFIGFHTKQPKQDSGTYKESLLSEEELLTLSRLEIWAELPYLPRPTADT